MTDWEISDNITKNQVPLCSICKSYPIFSVHESNYQNILEQCPHCKTISEKSITSVLNDIYIDQEKLKHECELPEHSISNTVAYYYCIQCEKWLCEFCKRNHIQQHEIIEGENRIPCMCQEHKFQYEKYCIQCNKNLCKTCIEQHDKQHHLLNTQEMIENEQEDFKECYKTLVKHNKDFKMFHNKFIKAIEKYITDIKTAYTKVEKVNYNIQKMYESFFNKLSYTKKNYYLYENLKNFANFSFKKFKYELSPNFNISSWSIRDIDEYKQYLNKGAVIVQSKTKTLDGIQRIATIKSNDHISTLANYIDNTTHKECIIIGYSTGAIRITESTKSNEIKCEELSSKKHKGVVLTLCVNDNYVYSGGDDQLINKWEIVYNKQNKKYELVHKQTYIGHQRDVNKIISIPEDRIIISCSSDRTVMIWDTSSQEDIVKPKSIIQMDEEIVSILYVPEMSSILTVLQNNVMEIRNIKEEKEVINITDIPCCSMNCLKRIEDNIIVGGGHMISKLNINNGKLELDCQIDISKRRYPDMKITNDMVSVIPFQKDEVLFGNIQNGLFRYNFKSDNIEFREITGKKNIDGMYMLDNNKFAIMFGKEIYIMSD